MYYFSIWYILAASCFLNITHHGKNVARTALIATYFSIALTSGLRYETGTDYFAYSGIYRNIFPLNIAIERGEIFAINHLIEPGYLFICSIFSMFDLSINIMFLFISLTTTALLFNSAKKYIPKHFYFGLLLYYCYVFFLLDMSGVRQAIAVNLFIYSIRYILEKNVLKFILIIAIAISFHYTAAILLFLYPLYNIRFTKKSMILIMVFSFITLVLKINWMGSALDILGFILNNDLFSAKLLTYASSNSLTFNRSLSPVMLVYVPIYIAAVLYRDRLSLITPYYNIILNIFLFFMVSVFALYESEDISVRISSYFMIGFCFIFPLTLNLVKNKSAKMAIAFAIFTISLYSIRNMIIGDQVSTLLFRPYQNYILIESGIQHSDAQKRTDIYLNQVGD